MGLFLFGGVGCGKTHLAISIMKHLIAKGKKVSFYKSSGLYDEYKRTFAFNNDETGEIFLQKLKKVDLLIIDDLGTDRFDDRFNLFFVDLISVSAAKIRNNLHICKYFINFYAKRHKKTHIPEEMCIFS